MSWGLGGGVLGWLCFHFLTLPRPRVRGGLTHCHEIRHYDLTERIRFSPPLQRSQRRRGFDMTGPGAMRDFPSRL